MWCVARWVWRVLVGAVWRLYVRVVQWPCVRGRAARLTGCGRGLCDSNRHSVGREPQWGVATWGKLSK